MSNTATKGLLSLLFISTSFWASATPDLKRQDREPEAATGLIAKETVVTDHAMVASANPYASKAGLNICLLYTSPSPRD